MRILANCCSSESHQVSMGRKRKLPEIYKRKDAGDFSDNELLATKKSRSALLDDQNEQGQEMDIYMTRHCSNILKKLMTHFSIRAFNQPVDPIKLNIPDYFSIVSRPMDLGTIKNKLERKLYLSTHQFAADVRLTFSNAMRYNPPGNLFNKMAKELNKIFSSSWRPLEAKWRKDCSIITQQSQKQVFTSKQVVQKTSTFSSNLLHRKPLASSEKKLNSRCAKVADEGKKSTQISVQDPRKGSLGAIKALTCPSVCTTDTRDSVDHLSNITLASSSDVDSERSCRVNHSRCSIASNQGCERITVGPERVNLNTDGGQGAATVVDGNRSSPAATFGEDDPSWNQQLSSSQAIRVAMLKERFAEVILKTQQKTLLNQDESGDLMRMKREIEKLQKKQREEKARIEVKVKAAEAAVRMKAEAKLKMQREKQREAARLALQKMERSVLVDQQSYIRKVLKEMGYSQPDVMVADWMYGSDLQSGHVSPLELLGLFRKKDDMDDDDEGDDRLSDAAVDGDGGVEEGEIR